MLKIGIIGCGAIGTILAKAIDEGNIDGAKLIALNDIVKEKSEKLSNSINSKPKIMGIEELIDASDLIIESSCQNAVEQIFDLITGKKHKDILIMSVGALIKNTKLLELAKKNNTNIHIPSGAVAGIDALKAANIGNIKSVEITTTKPINGLKQAPYIEKNNIDLNKIKKKTLIFQGNAIEAINAFPKNINVSATISLAGIGAEKTKVKIIADPKSKINIHQLKIIGDFGEILTIVKNKPCPQNPKTSYLAALSAIAKIKEITNKDLKIGT